MDAVSRYHSRRAKGLCGRNGCAHHSGTRSLCSRHLAEQATRSVRYRFETRGVMGKVAIRALNLAGTFATAFFLLGSTATADETAKPASAAPIAESKYCARADEAIEDRIARLEVALRLARAELVVNRKRVRK
jgi:hypothetical protein